MTQDETRSPAVIVLVVGGWRLTVGCLVGGVRCDLTLVDGLLRLRLAARRRGWSILLVHQRADLRELVELVGVVELFEGCGRPSAD